MIKRNQKSLYIQGKDCCELASNPEYQDVTRWETGCAGHFTPGKNTGWQNSTAKIDLVRACFKDGKWTAAGKGHALLCNLEEELRKTNKDMDRVHEGRHGRKKYTIWGNLGYCAWHTETETDSSSLIFLMMEERERERRTVTGAASQLGGTRVARTCTEQRSTLLLLLLLGRQISSRPLSRRLGEFAPASREMSLQEAALLSDPLL